MLDYTNNGITIYCHKSGRKNAKISDIISVCHLISQSDDKQVRDSRILSQLIDTFGEVIYECIQFNHMELTVYLRLGHTVNMDGKETVHTDYYAFHRTEFTQPEEVLIFLLRLYHLIYPYTKLSNSTVFSSPSIQYILNMWKHREEAKNLVERGYK